MSDQRLEEFLTRLPGWNRFADGCELSPVIAANQSLLMELRRRLLNLRRRLRDGPYAPLRIAIFGPTGAGKSKLFSSLIGCHASPSGYRRPYTRRALYYVHDQWRALGPALAGNVRFHESDAWRDRILIDTPDFDSVEVDNRAEAERVFLETDGFLFVTDGLKYADASTWQYLRRIRASEKPFCIVLNKVNSSAISESFAERYQNTLGADGPCQPRPVVIPEFAIDDERLIDAQHPAMLELRAAVANQFHGSNAQVSARMFQGEAIGVFSTAAQLRAAVVERQGQLANLRARLDERLQESQQRLNDRLAADLDPAVREEVYQRVLRRLDAIDLLRYPRQLLTLPFRGLRSWLERGWQRDQKSKAAPESPGPVTSESFHVLEAELIRFADESRLDVISEPGLEKLIDRATFHRLRLEHGELERRFTEHHEQFRDWVARHARETAAEITGENKAKFILSQVLFNTVLITAQFHTGGALSLLELGIDGVLSPLVARAVGMAIGNEKVRRFERDAQQQHQRSLSAIAAASRDRFVAFLEESAPGLNQLQDVLGQICNHQDVVDKLIARFEASGGPAGTTTAGAETTLGEGRGES
jgi:ABC-type multidrug transport system fused ATPase/permease subunit